MKQPPPPLKFDLATPNTHQIIVLCLGNNMALNLTEAILKKTLLAQRGQQLLPPWAIFCRISSDFCQFQDVIWSAWLRVEAS